MIGTIARSLSFFFLSFFAAAQTDGRSIWDPDGAETAGRGVWDPNG